MSDPAFTPRAVPRWRPEDDGSSYVPPVSTVERVLYGVKPVEPAQPAVPVEPVRPRRQTATAAVMAELRTGPKFRHELARALRHLTRDDLGDALDRLVDSKRAVRNASTGRYHVCWNGGGFGEDGKALVAEKPKASARAAEKPAPVAAPAPIPDAELATLPAEVVKQLSRGERERWRRLRHGPGKRTGITPAIREALQGGPRTIAQLVEVLPQFTKLQIRSNVDQLVHHGRAFAVAGTTPRQYGLSG